MTFQPALTSEQRQTAEEHLENMRARLVLTRALDGEGSVLGWGDTALCLAFDEAGNAYPTAVHRARVFTKEERGMGQSPRHPYLLQEYTNGKGQKAALFGRDLMIRTTIENLEDTIQFFEAALVECKPEETA